MRLLGLFLAVLVAAPGTARPDSQTDRALRALQSSDSLKVRSQAALILGELKAPEAVAALRRAAVSDPAPAVRIAAVTALARYGDAESRAVLEQLQKSDPDAGVRTSAAGALASLEPAQAPPARGRGEVFLEETVGSAGRPSDRIALRDAIGRRLVEAGFRVGAGQTGLRLKPSIVRLEVERVNEKTVIQVRAELVAVEGGGRMAAMLEGAAKLSAQGSLGDRELNAVSGRALDAVAKILVEDLAAKLAER
jgi:hypothetical protein